MREYIYLQIKHFLIGAIIPFILLTLMFLSGFMSGVNSSQELFLSVYKETGSIEKALSVFLKCNDEAKQLLIEIAP